MRYSRQLRSFGYIKPATKQGEKEKPKNAAEIAEKNRIKDICLNCTARECGNRCRYFAKKVRDNG
jgi:hypothetical protein